MTGTVKSAGDYSG